MRIVQMRRENRKKKKNYVKNCVFWLHLTILKLQTPTPPLVSQRVKYCKNQNNVWGMTNCQISDSLPKILQKISGHLGLILTSLDGTVSEIFADLRISSTVSRN